MTEKEMVFLVLLYFHGLIFFKMQKQSMAGHFFNSKYWTKVLLKLFSIKNPEIKCSYDSILFKIVK